MSASDWEHLERLKEHIINGNVITIIWSVEDVLYLAEENNCILTRPQAQEVLASVERGHDAEFGISWETLRYHIDDMQMVSPTTQPTAQPTTQPMKGDV